jgi:hypothetical protein
MILLSNYLGISDELDDKGVFDQILNFDANYFIILKDLKKILSVNLNIHMKK